ncbi:hypothetical protein VMCG_01318 [Cytospora schulzeri]|uniref:Uncharacterized protein n=1 Tax=Cytospora schulzeri TaxID=448051 RepID=A0A423X759_9PEZI|nr:hypothetical protein VMCG_01318 [Valsa malicola]
MSDTNDITPTSVLDLMPEAFQSIGECLQSIGSLFRFVINVLKVLDLRRARQDNTQEP